MEMKIKDAIMHYNALTQRPSIVDQTLPSKLSYFISRNAKKLEEEVKNYNDEREKICKRLAEKDEEGSPITKDGKYDISEENKKILDEELEALLDTDIDVDIHMVEIDPILDQCDAAERYHVPTARELMALEFMIK